MGTQKTRVGLEEIGVGEPTATPGGWFWQHKSWGRGLGGEERRKSKRRKDTKCLTVNL